MRKESDIKFEAFCKEDKEHNHGLIINGLEEIRLINNNPKQGKSIRENLLYDILNFATEHSEFYKKYEDWKCLADFPVVNRETYRKYHDKVAVKEYYNRPDNRKKSTSGTTGTPFVLMWDHRKHSRMVSDMKYFAELCGCKSHERLCCLVSAKKGCSERSVEAQERDNVYNVVYHRMDDENIVRCLGEINDHKAKAFIAYAPMLRFIAQYMLRNPENKYDMPYLETIISEAELLEEKYVKVLENNLGCKLYNRYGTEENGILAQEDGSGKGNRINMGSLWIEILKEDCDEPQEDGKVGRVVITDLFCKAFPMIRYDLGDYAIKYTDKNGLEYITDIVGRVQDIFYDTKGLPVHTGYIRAAVYDFIELKQYQFIQESEKKYTWILNFENQTSEYEKLIEERTKKLIGEDAIVTFKYVDGIPSMASGKTKYVICKLNR